MVDIRPNQLPDAIIPLRETDEIIVDQGADGVRKASPFDAVNSATPVATQPEAVAGTDNIKRMTSLRTKQSIASEVGLTLASNSQGARADSAVQSVNGKTGESIILAKGDVGLGNVDNTSDSNKPISTATQNALDTKANSSVTISAGTGLTGGGNLTANMAVSLNAASIASLAKADSAVQTVNGVAPTGGNVTVAAEEKRLQDTRTTAIAESFGSNVQFVETAGYSSVGDGGGSLYKRVSSEPSHAGKFQSADGAWWEISSNDINFYQFGAKGDGVTDDAVAINATLNAASLMRINEVVQKKGGIFLYRSNLVIPEYMSLKGNKDTAFKRGNGVTAEIMLSNNSSLEGFIVDGNRIQNTDNLNAVLVRIGGSTNVSVKDCILHGSSGYGIVVNGGVNITVEGNLIYDYFSGGFAAFHDSFADSAISVIGNIFRDIGGGAILFQRVVGGKIIGNKCYGTLIGGRQDRMLVSSSGTTLTRGAGGASFDYLKPGQFVILNGGMEFRIKSITNSVSLETETAMPTLNNVQGSCGVGDMIGLISCNTCIVSQNHVYSTATYGMGCSTMGLNVGNNQLIFSENIINQAGKNAISIAKDSGLGQTIDISITGNKMVNPGYAGGIGAADRTAIVLQSTEVGNLSNVIIDCNSTISYSGEGQTTALIGRVGSVAVGDYVLGVNVARDTVNGIGS